MPSLRPEITLRRSQARKCIFPWRANGHRSSAEPLGRCRGVNRKLSGTPIAETTDPTLMAKWALEWNDLFEMGVRPVITDEQAGPLMAQIGKQ